MPFTQQLLLNVPAWLLCTILLIISLVITIGGILAMRKFIPHHKLKVHNDVAGPIFSTLGVIYAVLLAFIAVITWENFDRSNLNVEKEANCLADLYSDTQGLSEPFKGQALSLLTQYAQDVVNEEWKALNRGEEGQHTTQTVKEIWQLYSGYSPKNPKEEIFFRESLKKLSELSGLRRIRIMDSKTGINPMLWLVLILGGMITIAFTFFFGAENLRAQLAMSCLLAALIVLVLFTILQLDFPFTGRISIQPAAFERLLKIQ